MPRRDGGSRASRSSATKRFSSGVGMRRGVLLEERDDMVEQPRDAAPALRRDVTTIGGRWRRRAVEPAPTSSIVDGRRCPTWTGRRASSSRPSGPRPRRPGPARLCPPTRRRARAPHRPAPPLRARAAPSSTRSPAADGACAAAPPCRRARTSARRARARCRSRRASCRERPRRAHAPVRRTRSAGSTCRRSAGRGSRPGSPPSRSRRPRPRAGAPTISSSRSPVPWPCMAEIGIGSPRPRRWNSWANASAAGSSILFASTITGRPDRRRRSASSSSPGVIPARASTTKSTRSASPIAARACSTIAACDRRRVDDVDAAGVDDREPLACPLADELLAVAGHARGLVDDGRARLRQPVDRASTCRRSG